MSDMFSTPAEHAFEHDEIEQAIAGPSTMGDATEELSVLEAFEVEDTIRRIRDGGYKTVRLQPFQSGSMTEAILWNTS
jgi:diphthamide biosynthesis protein 2